MYFDAVLDKNLNPLFNDTPGETLAWIEDNGITDETLVGVGRTLEVITVKEYKSRK